MKEYDSGQKRFKTSAKVTGRSGNANRFRVKNYEPKAYVDDYSIDSSWFGGGEYKEREGTLSFDLLKEISHKVAPITAIINTRIDQMGMFTSPARLGSDGIGYRVKLKEGSRDPSEDEEKEIYQIEEFIYNCGDNKDPSRDNFDTFIRKIMRDSLTYDQVNFEILKNDEGKPLEFFAVDASTIRSATEDYEGDIWEDTMTPADDEEIRYVQLIDGNIVTWFTADELAFATRNPSTNVENQPYGISEIEVIVKQLDSYIDTEEYNMRFFKQGGLTQGIFNIKEDPSGIAGADTLQSFKRQWRTQVTGQKGAWKIPVLQLPGSLEYINISQDNGEMVFEKWINYLINIICSVYRIDPAEINFPNSGGAGGTGGGIFEGSSQAKYEQSRSKGLFPLLQFIENTINKYIVSLFDDKYIFKFEGMNETSETEQLQIDKQEVETYMTINEKRQEKGLAEIEDGDIIANPYFMQNKQQSATGSGPGGFGGFDFDDDIDSDLGDDFEDFGFESQDNPGNEEKGLEIENSPGTDDFKVKDDKEVTTKSIIISKLT